jgi:hypothetical protein
MDPTMAALRTDGGRVALRELRQTYARADQASRDERRRLLRQAAVETWAMLRAEGRV